MTTLYLVQNILGLAIWVYLMVSFDRRVKKRLEYNRQTFEDRQLILKIFRIDADNPIPSPNIFMDDIFSMAEMDLVDYEDHLQAYVRGENPWELYSPLIREKVGK